MKRKAQKTHRTWWQNILITLGAFTVAIATISIIFIFIGRNPNTLEDYVNANKSAMIQEGIKNSNGTIVGGDVKVIDNETIEISYNLITGYEDTDTGTDPATIEQSLTSDNTIKVLTKSFKSTAEDLKIDHLTINYIYLTSTGAVFARASIPLYFD